MQICRSMQQHCRMRAVLCALHSTVPCSRWLPAETDILVTVLLSHMYNKGEAYNGMIDGANALLQVRALLRAGRQRAVGGRGQ